MKPAQIVVDGNEAAARVAHSLSEVIAIYPITPASPMGELADAWSQRSDPNIWGTIPEVVEMQSEGGAAGAIHGALQAGALTTTFTASQGLLLMLPNMYKIAGELTPCVIHVAARTLATHALSIFGDHSDVMSARQTGFAMLCSESVQESQDLSLISHAVTLRTRVPFLHFFDGFRTSHEVMKIEGLAPETITGLVDPKLIADHRERALNPNRPVLRGTAQNPDVFFQAREAANLYHDAVPDAVELAFNEFAELTGRRYELFQYFGAPDAERVVVLMGSGAGAARQATEALQARGEKVGLLVVHLYRPFSINHFTDALPDTVTSIAVLDRTKEPGAVGEPLYQDVVAALSEAGRSNINVIGGRYGLSGKEFTPPMVMSVFAEAAAAEPRRHFTVGITDDVSHLSLTVDEPWQEPGDVIQAVFFGLGADGTVGANKNSVKIIGTHTDQYAQGHFVYDSKKSGAVTVSHLRFSPRPIESTYLINHANFVACHQFGFLEKVDMLDLADEGASFLLNSQYGPDEIWDQLPAKVQGQIISKNLRLFVVDGNAVAKEAGLGGRINTVLQTCFFALADIIPKDEAIAAIKESIESAYGKRGEVVLQRNYAAVDGALAALHEVTIPAAVDSTIEMRLPVPVQAPDFVQRVTGMIIGGKGDLLPVSAMPLDGTFPTATAKWEKRSIAPEIPIWDPDICIDCGRCAMACPHAAIRIKVYDPTELEAAPDSFQTKAWKSKEYAGKNLTVQVAPLDCTGCGVCVDVCPAHSKEVVKHKSINMEPKLDHVDVEETNFDFFLEIPEIDRTEVRIGSIAGSQLLEPLFEYSGACSGCGETPYLKLLSQMFGDRILIANATGCSSIYGGNLPTTPYSQNADGRGPAWSNSLFEDNAEFGLGMRLAIEGHERTARRLVSEMAPQLGGIAAELLDADQSDEAGLKKQRERVQTLLTQLKEIDDPLARELETTAEYLVRMGVWIVGGDGWAYDIGFGGLDHVMALGRNVNILVLDTEVYSNTGGQASKATPRAAVAKFAAGGKATGKKDLGMMAQSYGNVYVAQVAMGANMNQVVKAFSEAEAHDGTSVIIAYSPCIAHGIDMETMMSHQKDATQSGYWPLFRYDPAAEALEKPALRLDSRKPTIPFKDFAAKEGRFAMLSRTNPERASFLVEQAQADIDNRWQLYEQMVDVHRTAVFEDQEDE
ncbi:MAG: pyruvate:ferredoxin (flavodoxin) oxidoreductase [bacterium]|nr:pyruvate:ferredoxin (flavodoxin) oxidoreductase [bacterium]